MALQTSSDSDATMHPERRLARPLAKRPTADGGSRTLAQGLGWFSIGLGLAELIAPREMAHFIGVEDDLENRSLLRAAGLRELSSGVGILSQPSNAGWLWSRVGGDLMDLALLGAASSAQSTRRNRLALATFAVLGVTALDVLASRRLEARGGVSARRLPEHRVSAALHESGVSFTETITINRPVGEVYRFWRKLENLPSFMSHLESVKVQGDRISRWKARGPGGTHIEWDAEMLIDEPNKRIAWRSLPGADVDNAGNVRFSPGPRGRGCEVHVELLYRPPAGALGRAAARMLRQIPKQQIQNDLRAFKQVLELGEVVHSDASIHAGLHAAQPPKDKPERLLAGHIQAGNGGRS